MSVSDSDKVIEVASFIFLAGFFIVGDPVIVVDHVLVRIFAFWQMKS